MAKDKAPVAPATAEATTTATAAFPMKPEKSDRELAEFAIRALYGCGIPESQSRLAGYDEATIKAIAQAEREKRRDRVPNILAKAHPANG